MTFAPKRMLESSTLPRRSSSLRASSASSLRSRTPSSSYKSALDTTGSTLASIAEGEGKANGVGSLSRPRNSIPPLTRKKSVSSLRSRVASETSSTDGARNPAVQSQDPRARPRPMSVSGIPSPTSSRSNTSHCRRDKYEGLIDDNVPRKTTNGRSASSNLEKKLNGESKTIVPSMTKTIVPPRESSRRAQDPPKPKREISVSGLKDALSISQTRLPAKDTSPTRIGTIPHLRPVAKDPVSPSHNRQSSTATVISLHARKPSKDNKQPPNKIPLKTKPSKELSVSPHSLRTTLSKEHVLRTQRSRDFSPTSTPAASPKPKSRLTTATTPSTFPTDAPPEQIRLLQLLHLIPLSERALETYESSAHEQLSARYDMLQERFERIQKQDHAQTLAERVATLREWSDSHIRSLSNLLVDWESLTIDFRAFCKRLANSLKPINKSVLEERGIPQTPEEHSFPGAGVSFGAIGLTVDRLFSRLHDLEVVLVGLPVTTGWPGQVIDEMRFNLPLLKRELEMAITVAGLRWRREVLQIEAKRMDVVKRLSLGKPTSDSVICAWRE